MKKYITTLSLIHTVRVHTVKNIETKTNSYLSCISLKLTQGYFGTRFQVDRIKILSSDLVDRGISHECKKLLLGNYRTGIKAMHWYPMYSIVS